MAWRETGNRPLSEPMMVYLTDYIGSKIMHFESYFIKALLIDKM